jgi:hypothetical protein
MDGIYFTPPLAERLPLKLLVEDDTTTVKSLSARPWVNEEVRASLNQANVVFVQWEEFRESEIPVFPTHTAELFHYVQEQAPAEIHSEVAVRDEDYHEVSLHADLVWLPDILITGTATALVLPIVVNLISEWLKKHLLERHARADAKLQVIIESPTGGSKRITYEGPVDGLHQITELVRRTEQISAVTSTVLPPATEASALLNLPTDNRADKS